MSETKRFSMMWGKDEDGCIYISPFEHLHGDWVRHGDYARLKAEVERLDTLCKQVMAQHSDISCENIMLRKAGDAMWNALLCSGCSVCEGMDDRGGKAMDVWNAAKEDKPSV